MKHTDSRLKHGMYKTRFNNTWRHILQRCNNPKDRQYHNYGGRGIKCLWKSFEKFRDDMYDSYLRHKKRHGYFNTTIDRVDNDGPYSKENCRWATRAQQGLNRSTTIFVTIDGVTKCLNHWAKVIGISQSVMNSRIKRGWSPEEAVLTKPQKNNFHQRVPRDNTSYRQRPKDSRGRFFVESPKF